ncbi:MAG: two-component sensor histidine kinase [Acidobacteria bacterium]|nr:two-component sensor histidine kinase [Acidobacteriota bacterium]
MRLKTKLVLVTTALTFAIVLVLSIVFLSELTRQRIEQTVSANDVLAHQVLLSTRKALVNGLEAHPPTAPGDEAFHAAIVDALRADEPLASLMSSIVRYSPTVQDVTVTDAHRNVLTSSDPVLLDQPAPYRTLLSEVRDEDIYRQARVVFGPPQVLDIPLSLERNGAPFLTVHLGVRSSLLRNSYAPLLKSSILFSGFAIAGCILAALLLSTVALRPIQEINRRLDRLSALEEDTNLEEKKNLQDDAVVRAEDTITRLGHKIKLSEQEQSRLQSNLNQMLNTLKDGILLFTGDDRVVMASGAIATFLPHAPEKILNATVSEVFSGNSALEQHVRSAFSAKQDVEDEPVRLPNGRLIELSIDFLAGDTDTSLGAMLTLHDAETELELEQEIQVSRRLAAIGRLTAGVGHEVKNPINAMVVHLELLRSKLSNDSAQQSTLRHVDILSSEMQRLDRVVQTLADFSRPLELRLRDYDLHDIARSVIELASVQLEQNGTHLDYRPAGSPLIVRVDPDVLQQALLNILLNAAQSMPNGGDVHLALSSDNHEAMISIRDHGSGIPSEARNRIFDLYFTTKPSGSGIGLAMTYRIVQLHGGAISFRSSTLEESAALGGEVGTEFQIRLPLAHKLIAAHTQNAQHTV